jgi:predicted GIY-YIG superfamily endonuclease
MAGLGPVIHETVMDDSHDEAAEDGRRMGLLHDEPAERHLICRCYRQSAASRLGASRRHCRGFHEAVRLEAPRVFQQFDDIRYARQREQNLKHYSRAWKLRLILLNNPDWDDFYKQLI